MRWLLGMPAVGALLLMWMVELRANATPPGATLANARELAPEVDPRRSATAFVRSADGGDVVGLVRFWETGEGRIAWDLELYGLPPGQHGLHVHAERDCAAAPASYDPYAPVGADERFHVGDLGTIRADDLGRVATRGIDDQLTLRGEASIVGQAVVVHANPDDPSSGPAGDAGARVGCGVIRPFPPRNPSHTAPVEEG